VKAYLLAAGRGKRAGGPKAWLPYEGTPLLERQIAFLLKRCRPQEIYVSIQGDWARRCQEINVDVNWIPVDADASPFDSLKRLVREAQPGWASLHHVDMPVWEPALFKALLDRAVSNCGAEALVPVHEGKRGHPVILSPRLQRRIAALDPATGRLDVLLRESRVEEVPVASPSIHENWNAKCPS
jgi:molybdenum cofactor cytidylyltransferase